jgi:ABC-2 type transport system permease protein
MSPILSIARKELNAAFRSPVGLLFLGVFLLATLVGFFPLSGFFARNMADVRPLFEWLPLLLILLVSAITMRQWAEERHSGTLEILLTLPVRTRDLVLGKFLAGLILVAVALLLTFPLPAMVARLGPLDWGPVLGGYCGALLLGAAYLAIGLCISARTDNQVVSLIGTLLLGGALYLLGTDDLTRLFAADGAEVLRSLGTGSRFESLERGVLDLRDLVYYGSIAVFFLVLNVHFLEAPRIDAAAQPERLRGRSLLVGLVGANVVALNLWLAPVTSLRADLTAGGEYSISDATRRTLVELGEPLYIDAYFSDRSHPLLTPLVPQIRDLLQEYEVAGQGTVQLGGGNPSADDELAREIGEQYGIRSVPFSVEDRHSQGVVNAFFHLLVRYGDQYATLSFEDLVHVEASQDGVEVGLRNFEYDLTRTIRKVTQDFQSLASLAARLPSDLSMTLYASPDTLPIEFAATVADMRTLATDLEEKTGGILAMQEIDPTSDPQLQQTLFETLSIRPLAADLFGTQVFYAHLVFETPQATERLLLRGGATPGDLERSVEAAIRRLVPGQRTSIGLVTVTPAATPPNPNLPPQMQPPQAQEDFRALRSMLGEEYDVQKLDLSSGDVPDDVDVILVGKAGALDEKSLFALDQFLMRGGTVVALVGAWKTSVGQSGLGVEATDASLRDLVAHWGVEVGPTLVMDPQNAPFPVPVQVRQGPFVMEQIQLVPYPFFPDIRRDGLAAEHASLRGLPNVTVPWGSPLSTLALAEGVESTVLASSSEGSWLNDSGEIAPDFTQWPETGYGEPTEAETAPHSLAVVLSGPIPSWFTERPSPVWTADAGAASDAEADLTGRTLKHAVPEARLAVIGSSELVSDLMISLANSPSGEMHQGNLQWVRNLVDWAVEDTDLLEIRASGSVARTLVPMTDAARSRWEAMTSLLVMAGLAAVVLSTRRRRNPVEVSRVA